MLDKREFEIYSQDQDHSLATRKLSLAWDSKKHWEGSVSAMGQRKRGGDDSGDSEWSPKSRAPASSRPKGSATTKPTAKRPSESPTSSSVELSPSRQQTSTSISSKQYLQRTKTSGISTLIKGIIPNKRAARESSTARSIKNEDSNMDIYDFPDDITLSSSAEETEGKENNYISNSDDGKRRKTHSAPLSTISRYSLRNARNWQTDLFTGRDIHKGKDIGNSDGVDDLEASQLEAAIKESMLDIRQPRNSPQLPHPWNIPTLPDAPTLVHLNIIVKHEPVPFTSIPALILKICFPLDVVGRGLDFTVSKEERSILFVWNRGHESAQDLSDKMLIDEHISLPYISAVGEEGMAKVMIPDAYEIMHTKEKIKHCDKGSGFSKRKWLIGVTREKCQPSQISCFVIRVGLRMKPETYKDVRQKQMAEHWRNMGNVGNPPKATGQCSDATVGSGPSINENTRRLRNKGMRNIGPGEILPVPPNFDAPCPHVKVESLQRIDFLTEPTQFSSRRNNENNNRSTSMRKLTTASSTPHRSLRSSKLSSDASAAISLESDEESISPTSKPSQNSKRVKRERETTAPVIKSEASTVSTSPTQKKLKQTTLKFQRKLLPPPPELSGRAVRGGGKFDDGEDAFSVMEDLRIPKI